MKYIYIGGTIVVDYFTLTKGSIVDENIYQTIIDINPALKNKLLSLTEFANKKEELKNTSKKTLIIN